MTAAEDSRLSAVRKKWDVVTPPGARWYAVPHTRAGRSRLVAELRNLPVGAPVVLCDAWPRSTGRGRRIAARADIGKTRYYVALPTLYRAVALIQDEPTTARYVAKSLLVAPLRSSWAARFQRLLMPLVRALLSSRARSVVFTGRLVLGERS
jgi:hypothetical protein